MHFGIESVPDPLCFFLTHEKVTWCDIHGCNKGNGFLSFFESVICHLTMPRESKCSITSLQRKEGLCFSRLDQKPIFLYYVGANPCQKYRGQCHNSWNTCQAGCCVILISTPRSPASEQHEEYWWLRVDYRSMGSNVHSSSKETQLFWTHFPGDSGSLTLTPGHVHFVKWFWEYLHSSQKESQLSMLRFFWRRVYSSNFCFKMIKVIFCWCQLGQVYYYCCSRSLDHSVCYLVMICKYIIIFLQLAHHVLLSHYLFCFL